MQTTTRIRLVPLTRNNWERALTLKPADDQADFQPDVLFSLAQSRFEQSEPFGIYLDGQMIGFALVCWFNHMPWITRFLIDAQWQGQGHGRDALHCLCNKLLGKPNVDEIRTTVAIRNAAAEYLFQQAGFVRTGELEGREWVMALRAPSA